MRQYSPCATTASGSSAPIRCRTSASFQSPTEISKKEPCRAAHIPAGIRPDKPRDSGNRQHNERGEAPAVIGRAGPPRASQDEQRRNDRKEKKDVIEIQAER